MKNLKQAIRLYRKINSALRELGNKGLALLRNQTFQGMALLWLVIRVEGLHLKVNEFVDYLNAVFVTVSVNLINWHEQVRALMIAVVNLFGGEGS